MVLKKEATPKTQIKDLINGDKAVYRNIKHPKYIDAKLISLNEYVGSSSKERAEVRLKVLEENPRTMQVSLFGKELLLVRSSAIGQAINFIGEITEEDFLLFTGNTYSPILDRERKYILSVTDNMTVQAEVFTRRSENFSWRSKGWKYIDECFVSIK